MFGQFGSKPTRTRKATRKTYPKTQAIVEALAAQDLRVGYDALSVMALALGEARPSGQSHGQRGASLVGSFPVVLQQMVCRGGQDEDRVGTYHPKAIAKWSEAGISPREDLSSLAVVRSHEADEVVLTWLERAGGQVDLETGEIRVEDEDETEDLADEDEDETLTIDED